MKPGHVFTIEPMINMGSWHDQLWPDDWTAVTQDGKRSAQFEHTILVTETGCEVLATLIFIDYLAGSNCEKEELIQSSGLIMLLHSYISL
jgi:hypothetical protein